MSKFKKEKKQESEKNPPSDGYGGKDMDKGEGMGVEKPARKAEEYKHRDARGPGES